MAKTTQIFLVNAYAIPGDLPAKGWADGEIAIVQSTHSLYTWNEGTLSWVLIGTAGAGLVNSVTDDGNMVVVVDNTIPTDPVIKFNGVFVDGVTITGTGQNGDPLIATAVATNPGGVDTNVQYNDSGAFGGDSNFTWNKNNRVFEVGDIGGTHNQSILYLDDTSKLGVFRIDAAGNNQELLLSSSSNIASLISSNASILVKGANNSIAFLPNALNRVEIFDTFTQFDPYGTSAGNTYSIRFLELLANGTDYIGYKAPDERTSNTSLSLVLPPDDPVDGQTMVFTAPVAGVSIGSWGSSGGIDNIDGGFPGDIYSPPLSPLDGGGP